MDGRVFGSKIFGPSEKIPSVVVNNVRDLGFYCSHDYVWFVLLGLFKMNCLNE